MLSAMMIKQGTLPLLIWSQMTHASDLLHQGTEMMKPVNMVKLMVSKLFNAALP